MEKDINDKISGLSSVWDLLIMIVFEIILVLFAFCFLESALEISFWGFEFSTFSYAIGQALPVLSLISNSSLNRSRCLGLSVLFAS